LQTAIVSLVTPEEMNSPPVSLLGLGQVTGQQPPEMALVQDNHAAQAVTADVANEPFHIGILPWVLGGNENLINPQVSHSPPKVRPVDTITVAQEIPWCVVSRAGVDHLLAGPLRAGVRRDITMDKTMSLMGQDEQDGQVSAFSSLT
jgi:hypothetical protein